MTAQGPTRPEDHGHGPAGPPFEILTVCVLNVCRSVFAERLVRRALAIRLGPLAARFHTASAGTMAEPGRPIHPYVRDILGGYGARTDGFASRRLTASMVAGADLVLTATAAVRDETIELVPAALGRTFTLREFARLGEYVGPVTATGAPVDVRELARTAVAETHRIRGLAPYLDPAANDIADPGPTRAAFRDCAAGIADAAASAALRLTPAAGDTADVDRPSLVGGRTGSV